MTRQPFTPMAYDKKAVQILFDSYWTSKGWREPHFTDPDDLAYAISKGVMFPPVLMPHEATYARLQALCESITPEQMGDAFLASLGSRDMALRSALGSFACGRVFPAHAFRSHVRTKYCQVCSLLEAPTEYQATDLNVLNFERLKWGGVRHYMLDYQVFDLNEFMKLEVPEPSEGDIELFREILATVRWLAPGSPASKLQKALPKSLAKNSSERTRLLEILFYSGILAYPGYVHFYDKSEPPKGRPYRDTDWSEPAMYWRAEDGYNLERLKEYFPRHVTKLATA